MARERIALHDRLRTQPNAMALLGADARYLEINEAFVQLTGVDRDEAIGRTATELGLWADEYDASPDCCGSAARFGPGLRRGRLRVRSRTGKLKTGLVSIETVQLNEQRCLLMSFLDITDRKTSELALAASHRELSRAYDTTLTGLGGAPSSCATPNRGP